MIPGPTCRYSHVTDGSGPRLSLVAVCLLAVIVSLGGAVTSRTMGDEFIDTLTVVTDSSVVEYDSTEKGSPVIGEPQTTPDDSCAPVAVNTAFGKGEWLHFSVQYGFVKAGDALMQVQGIEDVDGHSCYHLVSKAESSNFFSLFFKVRDKVESYLDKREFVSRRFSKKIHEGKHRRDSSVEFNHLARLASYSDGTEAELLPCSQDILSAFYYVRMLKLNVGERVSVPCHADKKNYPLQVIVHRKETVGTPAGKFDCIVVEPVLKSEGIFQQKGRLTIWLTDDERKIPVLMKSKVAVGSISAILTDMHLAPVGG